MNTLLRKAIALFLLTSSFINPAAAQIDKEMQLVAKETIDTTLSAAQSHTYTAELENGMAIIGKVTQKGIDLVVDVYKPNGKLLKQIDSPNGTDGDEPFDITANESGLYKFVIHSLDKRSKKGKYTLKTEQILSLSENTERTTKKELPTEALYQLWKASLTDKTAIETFVASHQEKHIMEPIEGDNTHMLLTYFCIPNENTEYVMLSGGPDFLGLRFQQLPNTKLHFVTQKVPTDARFNYGFNYFNLDLAGPKNEIQSRSVQHAYDGTVEMPDAPKQTYITERKEVEKGKLLETAVHSNILSEERKITVHAPANYDASKPHNLLIVFDGESYGARPNRRSRVPTPTIMDNLLAENKITPTITVLVWAMGKRNRDLISEKFGDFIAKELIPWVRSAYNIYPESDKVVLAGSSRGGFASGFIAFKHSDVIGNVLSQSGSYWIKGTDNENHWIYPEDNGKLINLYKQSERLPIRFYMDIGLYDAGASMLGMNRQLRDILELKGYEVDYHEFKGGHNYVNWRGTLSDGIISLLGTN